MVCKGKAAEMGFLLRFAVSLKTNNIVRYRDDGSGDVASDTLRRHSVRYSKRKPTIVTGIFRGFLQSLQACDGITSFNRPRRVPSIFIPIHSDWSKFSNFRVIFPSRKIILDLCSNPLIAKEILSENFTVNRHPLIDVTLTGYLIHRHCNNICEYINGRPSLLNRNSPMRVRTGIVYKLSHVGQDILAVQSDKLSVFHYILQLS